MAGAIEYAIEQGMMKEALNAMSRNGYRELDLAHRMIRRADDGLAESGAGSRSVARNRAKINDLRTDYLHPTRHSVRGDMAGSKLLYKPLHQGGVDPSLAKASRRHVALVTRGADDTHRELNDIMRRSDIGFMEKTRMRDKPLQKLRGLTNSFGKGDSALYAPKFSRNDTGILTPSAELAQRGLTGWRRYKRVGDDMLHRSTLRHTPALNDLRQQLAKVQSNTNRSARRVLAKG